MILIIGRGHVGTWLAQQYSQSCVTHWKGQIEDLTPKFIEDIRPNAIINTAAKTDMVWCEQNPEQCYLNNVVKPLNFFRMVRDCRHLFGKFPIYIHTSSGCVWEGPYKEDNTPFTPSDPVSPACTYTQCKALLDQCLLSEFRQGMFIIRPRLVYSSVDSGRNLLKKILGYPKLINTPNSITSVQTIEATITAICRSCSFLTKSQVFNIYDKGIVTPLQIGYLLAAHGLRENPKVLQKQDLNSWHKPKRVDTVLYDKNFEQLVPCIDVYKNLEGNIEQFKRNLKSESQDVRS